MFDADDIAYVSDNLGESKDEENGRQVRVARDVSDFSDQKDIEMKGTSGDKMKATIEAKKKATGSGKKKVTGSGKQKATRGGKKKGTRGGKKKGTRGGKKKPTRKADTACPRQTKQFDDDCLSAAIKYQATANYFVANLERQFNRYLDYSLELSKSKLNLFPLWFRSLKFNGI